MTRGHHVQKAAINPATNDDHNPAIQLPNPCKLVSLSEARRSPTARPPAPPRRRSDATCVYKLQGAKGANGDITMALGAAPSLAQVTRHTARAPRRSAAKRRHGFCGKLGYADAVRAGAGRPGAAHHRSVRSSDSSSPRSRSAVSPPRVRINLPPARPRVVGGR